MRLKAYIDTASGQVPVWYSFQFERWLLTPTRDALNLLSVAKIADAIDSAQKYQLPLKGITTVDSRAGVC